MNAKKKIGNRIWIIASVMLLMLATLTACGNGKPEASNSEDNGVAVEVSPELDNVDGGSMPDDSSLNAEQEEAYVLQEVQIGDVAPEFTAPLADGGTFALSEHSGKVILLNFWATWCGPCVGEMPAFQDLYEEYGDQIAILAVNCMEDEETVNQFIEDMGYSFPIAYDVEGDVCMTYPSSGIPYTLVIGKDGIVKNIYVGAADAETQYKLYKSAIDASMEK